MAELTVQGLSLEVAGRALLSGIDLTLSPGEMVAVVGPNGAGKSTLLRAMLGLTRAAGEVLLDGAPLCRRSPVERARAIGWLPQFQDSAWPIRVADVVALGRFAHGAVPGRLSGDDAARVAASMAEAGCDHLAQRSSDMLSGGERQRVALARLFAGDTPLALIDEPVGALDPAAAGEVMATLRRRSDAGRGQLVVLHDINLALQYCDRMLWMKDGHIAAGSAATPAAILAHAPTIFGVVPIVLPDGGGLVFPRRA